MKGKGFRLHVAGEHRDVTVEIQGTFIAFCGRKFVYLIKKWLLSLSINGDSTFPRHSCLVHLPSAGTIYQYC